MPSKTKHKNDAVEFLDVVDSNDGVVGRATRKEVHNSEMWHRGIHILVFDHDGNLFLPLRSSTKDKFPNTYDCSVSGHVNSGETFDETAVREAREELGIVNPELKPLLKFRMNYGPNDNMISVLYKTEYAGRLSIDKKEIQKAEFLPLNGVRDMLVENETRFAYWTREILKWYFDLPSKVERID